MLRATDSSGASRLYPLVFFILAAGAATSTVSFEGSGQNFGFLKGQPSTVSTFSTSLKTCDTIGKRSLKKDLGCRSSGKLRSSGLVVFLSVSK